MIPSSEGIYYTVQISLICRYSHKRCLPSPICIPRIAYNLAKELVNPLPGWPLCSLGPILLDHSMRIHFSATGNQVHVGTAHKRCPEVDLVRDVEGDDDWRSE